MLLFKIPGICSFCSAVNLLVVVLELWLSGKQFTSDYLSSLNNHWIHCRTSTQATKCSGHVLITAIPTSTSFSMQHSYLFFKFKYTQPVTLTTELGAYLRRVHFYQTQTAHSRTQLTGLLSWADHCKSNLERTICSHRQLDVLCNAV